jgi:hypothetical protein
LYEDLPSAWARPDVHRPCRWCSATVGIRSPSQLPLLCSPSRVLSISAHSYTGTIANGLFSRVHVGETHTDDRFDGFVPGPRLVGLLITPRMLRPISKPRVSDVNDISRAAHIDHRIGSATAAWNPLSRKKLWRNEMTYASAGATRGSRVN